MPTDRSPQDRLAGLATGQPAPPGPDLHEPVPAGREEAAEVRSRALAAATSAYAATYGHPLEHPTTSGPVRWGTSARTAVVVAGALTLVGVGVAVHALAGAPATVVLGQPVVPAPPTGASAGQDPGGTPAAPPAPAEGPAGEVVPGEVVPDGAAVGAAGVVVVHVVGQVRQPGVVELAAGSRVVDAVAAAGGATGDADLSGLNLARPVLDGEQVLVPRPGEGVPAPPGGAVVPGSAQPGTGPPAAVDLNRATAAELEALPGIGPVLAARIVEHRAEQGPFSSVDDLQAVRGVGTALLADLRDLVTT